MRQATQFIDPAQLHRVSDLELLARAVVEGFLTGVHRSPYSGASIEFAQYRPYVQGDDPRFVDWKLFGRTDRLHLKQFHEETNMRCTILLDCSASMDYGSAGLTKFNYARMLAASLAMLLSRQKDAPGFIAFHDEIISHIPPSAERRHARRVLVELANLEPARSTAAAPVLRFLGDVIKPRGMVILISDLLHPMEEVLEQLKSLRARRHDVMVMQVVDPAERDFPFELTSTFVDAESAEEQYAVPEIIRREYLDNRNAHFDALRAACLGAEIDLAEFDTREPLDHALLAYVRRRNRALVTSSMKRTRRGGVG